MNQQPDDLFQAVERKWGRPFRRADVAPSLCVDGPDDEVALADVEDFANSTLETLGLKQQGWTFAWDNAKVRAGQCSWGKKRITLSRHIAAIWPAYEVADTVLHEAAHALAGPGEGHGWRWKRMCRVLGANPTRCYENDLPQIEGDWTGTCPGGHTHTRHREPTRVVACTQCDSTFRFENVIQWKHKEGGGPGMKWMREWVFLANMNQKRSQS